LRRLKQSGLRQETYGFRRLPPEAGSPAQDWHKRRNESTFCNRSTSGTEAFPAGNDFEHPDLRGAAVVVTVVVVVVVVVEEGKRAKKEN
jgi:hypothetical protein